MKIQDLFEAPGKRPADYVRFWYDVPNKEMHAFNRDHNPKFKYHFQFVRDYFDLEDELHYPDEEHIDDADTIHALNDYALDRGWIRGTYNGYRNEMNLMGHAPYISTGLIHLVRSGWFKGVESLYIDSDDDISGLYKGLDLKKFLTSVRTT